MPIIRTLPTAVLLAFFAYASEASPVIPSTFTDKTYRIERQFVLEDTAKALLRDLVFDGVPQVNETFTPESVKAMGDAGGRGAFQPHVSNYSGALQSYLSDETRPDSLTSLVYYLEQLDGPPLDRSEDMIGAVTTNSVLEDGGTVHLYLSAPGASALANHTDTTDIVVVQLDGAKEWFLCAKPEDKPAETQLEEFELFSKKLDSCSSYSGIEIDNLDCERMILYPGDALFLPRRTVHSARALSNQFSAHLTFGFNEDEFCWAYSSNKKKSYEAQSTSFLRRLGKSSSSSSSSSSSDEASCEDGCHLECNGSCDRKCDFGCDKDCDASCDKLLVFSCDRKCDYSCDKSCDAECDSDCECVC